MNEVLHLLSFVFLQRALLAGILLAILSGVMGVITLMRKTSFYGDAVAHASLAGVSIGLMLGIYPLFTAVFYAVLVAISLPWIREKFRLSLDNVLGMVLPISMGIGVIIFSLLPGYQPEMLSFLFGNILTIRAQEIWFLLAVFIFVIIIFTLYLPRILATAIDEEYAMVLGVKVRWFQMIYEVLLTVIIVAGVKLLGVVLVNALLIIPASTTKNIARSLKQWLILSPLLSIIVVLSGIIFSVAIDTPPGATIAVVAGGFFVFIQVIFLFKNSLKLKK